MQLDQEILVLKQLHSPSSITSQDALDHLGMFHIQILFYNQVKSNQNTLIEGIILRIVVGSSSFEVCYIVFEQIFNFIIGKLDLVLTVHLEIEIFAVKKWEFLPTSRQRNPLFESHRKVDEYSMGDESKLVANASRD